MKDQEPKRDHKEMSKLAKIGIATLAVASLGICTLLSSAASYVGTGHKILIPISLNGDHLGFDEAGIYTQWISPYI